MPLLEKHAILMQIFRFVMYNNSLTHSMLTEKSILAPLNQNCFSEASCLNDSTNNC